MWTINTCKIQIREHLQPLDVSFQGNTKSVGVFAGGFTSVEELGFQGEHEPSPLCHEMIRILVLGTPMPVIILRKLHMLNP
jgi:hypothetical protein